MVANPTDLRDEGLVVEPGAGTASGAPIRQSNLWKDAWRRYIHNKGALVAGIFFVLILLFCLIVPIISPYDPNEVNFAIANEPPSLEHPFGTDKFGRDLFTRVALGGRVSILIAFGATLAILFIGVVYGSISGFVGGRLDNGMMRFLDALYGLPYLPFAIITLAIIGQHERLDDDDRALDRELVHDGSDRPRPGADAEGERLRPRGEGGRRALVSRPRPPPPPEHARHPDHRDLPRAARRDPGRGVPLLHRPRDQPAGRVLGGDGAGGPHASTGRIRRRSSSRPSRSRASSSARTSSRTACATPSTRGRRRP